MPLFLELGQIEDSSQNAQSRISFLDKDQVR